MKFKFTDARIAKLPPPPGRKDYLRFDTGKPHLAIRVAAKSKRFVFQRREEGGGQYRKTLGKFPTLTTTKARQAAEILAGKVAAGADLREEAVAKKAKRDQARAGGALSFEGLISLWEEAYRPLRRPRYVDGMVDGLRRVFARLLPKPANSITTEQIEACLESLADRPAAARVAGTRVRTLCRWGAKKRKLGADPTKQIDLAEKNKPRQNCLTGDEARLVWRAAGTLPAPDGPLIKFLMASMVRLRDAAESRRNEYTPDLSELTISGDRIKEGDPHVVWLPPIVREMLRQLPQFEGSDLLFTRDGKRPVTGFSGLKRKLDRALVGTAVKPFTFHDFRRTATTWLVRNGTDSIVADRLLAHTQLEKISAVASTYNTYAFEPERKAAIERWVNFLAEGEAGASASTSPPLMLPAPKVGTTPVEEAESPAIFWLTGMKDQIEASEAQAEENFISLLLRIGSDRDVNRVNFGIHKQEVFAPKFLATLGPQSDPHKVAISVLTHTAALAHVEGITVFKQREVETQRAKMTGEAERWHVEAERLDLESEQARAMGEGEFAVKAEAKARRARAIAGLWEMPLQTMMAASDVCVVRYRKGDPQLKDHRALGVYRMLLLQTEMIFGRSASDIAAAYATAATGEEMSRFRARQVVRDGKVMPPERLGR